MESASSALIDISPPLGSTTGVWPGDVALTRHVAMDTERGDHLTLSSLSATVHLGAHADAPSHTDSGAPSIDQVSLDPYVGPCTVVRCDTTSRGLVEVGAVESLELEPRVLFATETVTDIEQVASGFAALAPELIDHLADRGVVLVGIDTPSVDPFESEALETHHRLVARNVRNLENLLLSDVAAGRYELIALPLALVGFDASPVRAVLRTISQDRA